MRGDVASNANCMPCMAGISEGEVEWVELKEGSLSDGEFLQLCNLLQRYGGHDMDQWDNFRVNTVNGWVYVSMGREAALEDKEFRDVSP